jgi:hypothetical protein
MYFIYFEMALAIEPTKLVYIIHTWYLLQQSIIISRTNLESNIGKYY